jgi:zinc and cadmium transporter
MGSASFTLMLMSVVLVSLLSLIGVSLLSIRRTTLDGIVFILVGLAVGALFGDCFIHLLPEAYKDPKDAFGASLLVLCGILLFFILENFLHWRHEHARETGEIHPYGYLNLVADMAHNFIDGLLIGGSYLAGPAMGVATTTAVTLHEIPHEFGNFGVLVKAGFSPKKALFLNFLTALAAVAGGLIAWQVGTATGTFHHVLIPLTAGSFIYIAGSDLVPELQKETGLAKSLLQFLAILGGIGLMLGLKLLE